MGRLSRSALSGVLYRRTQATRLDLFIEVWGDIIEQAIVDWQPTTDIHVVRRKLFVAQLKDRDRALDADAILHDRGGEADGAGTGGHD